MSTPQRDAADTSATVCALRDAGTTVADIAAAVGWAEWRVYQALRVAGMTNPTKRPISDDERSAAVARHLAGETVSAIAADLGRKGATVKSWIRAEGYTPQLRSYDAEFRAAALARVAAGERAEDVASDVGVDPTTIREWRRRYS